MFENQSKKYYRENSEKCKNKSKKWAISNREASNKIKKTYRKSDTYKTWYINNKEHLKLLKKAWNIKNRDKFLIYKKRERVKNKTRYSNYYKKYKNERIKKDPLFLLRERIGCLIRNSISNGCKNTRSAEILKIPIEDFKIYIENQFVEGMTWDNYGEWQFDHKVPISLARNVDEFYKLNHYLNFRPLWRKENILKSNDMLDEYNDLKEKLLEV